MARKRIPIPKTPNKIEVKPTSKTPKDRIANFHRDVNTTFNKGTRVVDSPWINTATDNTKTTPKTASENVPKKEAPKELSPEEQIKVKREEIRTKYKNMTDKEKANFAEFQKSKFKPEKTIDLDTVNNATSLAANRKMLETFNDPMKNPILDLDTNLTKEIQSSLTSEIEKGEKYFADLRENIFKGQDMVQDLGAYGEAIEMLDRDIDKMTKKTLFSELGLAGDILPEDFGKEALGDKAFNRQVDDFVSKTFKGKASSTEDVASYMSNMTKYLDITSEDEMYKTIQGVVEKKGDLLGKLGEIERKATQKEIDYNKAVPNKSKTKVEQIEEKIKKKSEKKAQKIQKKANDKATKALRKATGTEGGTISDFIKGSGANKLGVGISVISAISDYKTGRDEGKTVLGSAADAGIAFATGELLGLPGMLTLGAIKGATSLGIKATKYAVESSRSMNNIQRFSPFADAQFQDTQQLATMRQSGMELAKMSQYNLQQTLMGTEARHLHR